MQKLKGLIVGAGYSQRTFAPRINMSVNTLNSKINGKKPFNTTEIDTICNTLSIVDTNEKAEIFLN